MWKIRAWHFPFERKKTVSIKLFPPSVAKALATNRRRRRCRCHLKPGKDRKKTAQNSTSSWEFLYKIIFIMH